MTMIKEKILLLIVFISLMINSTVGANEKRTALVIGNSRYQNSELLNPANDARLMSKTLKELGFKVNLLVDANQQQMEDAIDNFGRKLQNGGVGLFFYAGHGVQSRGVNYLIPLQADLQREKDLKYKAVDAGQILDEMANANNGLNIIILDACRNNPMSRSFRNSAKGLARMSNAPKGSLLAYSTAPGSVASDGGGSNSPYTEQLVKAMKKKNQPLEMAFKDVTKGVQKETKGKQTPWMSSSVTGDFYFAERIKEPVKPIKPGKLVDVKPTTDYEYRFWNEIKESPSQEMYQAYLQQYPKGHFSLIAQIRLDKLKQQSQQPKITSTQQLAKNNKIEKQSQPKKRASTILVNVEKTATTVKTATIEKTIVVDKTEKKLAVCKQHLRANRLSTGESGNALQCYQSILADKKNNKEALKGIKKIEHKYVKWFKKALKNKNKDRAVNFYKIIKKLNPDNTFLLALQKKYQNLIKQQKSPPKQFIAKPQVKKQLFKKLNNNFVLVKSGCFKMGNPNNKSGRNIRHEVCISKDFYMGKYEVTQGQWEKIMNSKPSYFRLCGKNCPVEKVSWSDVQKFIAKLNKRSGKNYRLPTESEWEYACRERGKEQIYCGSNSLSEFGWYSKNANFKTHPVGLKKPNRLGLYDMSGNVYEWTQDRLGTYPKIKTTDPQGVQWGSSRVLRGGSWRDGSSFSVSTARRGNKQNGSSKTLGFRLVKTK